MKTVTFKAGLLADWEHEAYFGPLMSLEEIKAPFDSLTDFLFSKYFFTTHSETHGIPVEKGKLSFSNILIKILNFKSKSFGVSFTILPRSVLIYIKGNTCI